MIKSSELIVKFQYALQNKWGYIWGTEGELWTESDQKKLEKTTDSDRANSRKYGSKWIGHRVSDCSGLFYWAFKNLGGYMYHGSNTMYLKYCVQKGELKSGKRTDKGTLKPGTAVFCWNGKTYSHVGLYVGDGTVIEAASAQLGVITSKVTATKWKYWGELKGVTFDGSTPEPVPDPQPSRKTLRKGDKGEEVKALQTDLQKLGYGLGSYGIDGDFGRATMAAVEKFQLDHGLTVDGVCGPKTWAEIDKALSGATKKTFYTVTINGLSKTKANEIVKAYGGVITAE